MRKIIAVMVALMMVLAMLSSGALADRTKDNKGGEQRQNQGARDNDNDDDDNNGSEEEDADDDIDDDEDEDADDDDDDKNKGKDKDKDKDDDDEDEGADDDDNGSLNDDDDAKKEDKEDKHDDKPKAGPNHGNGYGRVRNTQEVLDGIGLLAGEETAVQLNTLMTAYREAKDAETAKAALTALLDALEQACTVAPAVENGEATDDQEQPTLENLEKLREKVLENAGNDNGTLLALMHAYENALRAMNNLEPVDDTDDGIETDDQTNTDSGTGPDPTPDI